MGTSVLYIFHSEDFSSRRPAGLRTREIGVSSRGRGPAARSAGRMTLPGSSQKITKSLQRYASKRRPSTSPDRNAHSFRTPQSAEQQPCNRPNPESAGKIICRSSLSRNSHCWERGCKRADQSPKKFPTNKIFLPHIPRLGAKVFHPFISPLLHGGRAGCAERGENDSALFLSKNNQITATVRIQAAALHEP